LMNFTAKLLKTMTTFRVSWQGSTKNPKKSSMLSRSLA
jgi:hypothetical protein